MRRACAHARVVFRATGVDELVYPGDRYVLVLYAPARQGCAKDGFKWYPDGGSGRRVVFRVDPPVAAGAAACTARA